MRWRIFTIISAVSLVACCLLALLTLFGVYIRVRLDTSWHVDWIVHEDVSEAAISFRCVVGDLPGEPPFPAGWTHGEIPVHRGGGWSFERRGIYCSRDWGIWNYPTGFTTYKYDQTYFGISDLDLLPLAAVLPGIWLLMRWREWLRQRRLRARGFPVSLPKKSPS